MKKYREISILLFIFFYSGIWAQEPIKYIEFSTDNQNEHLVGYGICFESSESHPLPINIFSNTLLIGNNSSLNSLVLSNEINYGYFLKGGIKLNYYLASNYVNLQFVIGFELYFFGQISYVQNIIENKYDNPKYIYVLRFAFDYHRN
jgi:hypothetical protein